MGQVVEKLFDARFDNHPYFIQMRKFQQSLPKDYKLNEEVSVWWIDSNEVSMYVLEGINRIQFYQNITGGIDIMVDFGFKNPSLALGEKILSLMKDVRQEYPTAEIFTTEKQDSSFIIIRNVQGNLFDVYKEIAQLMDRIEKERSLDEERHNLGYALLNLRNGVSYITTALLTFTEGNEKLEKIFSYSSAFLDKYFFSSSFDEESSQISDFVNDFVNAFLFPEHEPVPVHDDMGVVELCKTGFEKTKEALENIRNICVNYPSLQKELVTFEGDSQYNPFQLYGIVNFTDKFIDLYQTFQTELNQIQ